MNSSLKFKQQAWIGSRYEHGHANAATAVAAAVKQKARLVLQRPPVQPTAATSRTCLAVALAAAALN